MKRIGKIVVLLCFLLVGGVLSASASSHDRDRDGHNRSYDWRDRDHDGFDRRVDCNDRNAQIFPGAPEICGDNIDQNCDGVPDDGCTVTSPPPTEPTDPTEPPIPTDPTVPTDPVTPPTTGHTGLTYSGPELCLNCHDIEATEMFNSLHYQWQGDTPYMTFGPEKQGKIAGAVNSYCGNISGNWGGCSACHTGRGLVPETVQSPEQLANIDCLLCHQKEYRRIKVNGVMVPDTANMSISMDEAVQTVHLPQRENCLNCHAKAGGGDALKRGDLALASANTTDRTYDVHMATTGANLSCQACHSVENHRIAGRGTDLRATDLDVPVTCTNCHRSTPHSNSTLNRHTAKIACQTCHIPVYGKNAADTASTEATETERHWQQGSEHTTPPLHPVVVKANNLKPVYRFWNGLSENYMLGEIAGIDPATGAYPTSRPDGSINDGKLYPFKYKTSDYPLRTASQELIPLETSVFFASADADAAARAGLVNMGYSATDAYEWVTTDTFQALNHQVSPKSQALNCTNCHLKTTQLDLQGELGYAPKKPQSTCSTSCHSSSKAAEWRYGDWEEYQAHHNKHVNEKGATCADCHSFSR